MAAILACPLQIIDVVFAWRFPPVAPGDASHGLSGGSQSCLRPSVDTLDRGELLVAEADAA
jgi:hypothetical protein